MTGRPIVAERIDAREVILLAAYRVLPPRKQRSFLDALERHIDGQPFEECFVDRSIECEVNRRQATAIVQQEIERCRREGARDWRAALN